MKLILDVENTTTTRNKKLQLDPFESENTLTMVGVYNMDSGLELLLPFDHNEAKDTNGDNRLAIQYALNDATLLIMHNAQHDLQWVWESGFVYDGDIYDTMLGEYILVRGTGLPLSLEVCAQRRSLQVQKQSTLKDYYKKGYTTNEIPLDELTEYLSSDLHVTAALYLSQMEDYSREESHSLHNIRDITMDVCKTLTNIYRNGAKVDLAALDEVRVEFETERAAIEERLYKQVKELMGDTQINLNSPEQMSQVVFSRAIKTKKEWDVLFEHVETDKEFKHCVEANSLPIYKTNAYICPECNGKKFTYKTKKDGTPHAKPNKCKECNAEGYKLRNTKELAGLKFSAPSKAWVSANGFSTSKGNLAKLIIAAKTKNMDKAVSFLTDLQRLSALSSYLSTFVGGINTFTKPDGLLHVSLTQSITATGRFSGRNPNMQNMPRGKTFPVKKVFVSRWVGGHIMEADFAQLEFRVAAFLAQDPVAMQEVITGFDVHSYTAKVISDAGEPTSRQDAKAHTFAPLYGASGYGRTPAQAAYYEQFIKKYEGIGKWHKKLGDEAVRFEKITTPSGRQYAFPNTMRKANGTVTNFTMIKNYPVQGFATGDIVPVVLLEIERKLQPLKSLLINTVHDSVVIDIHPDEVDAVIQVITNLNTNLNEIINRYYAIDFNVPLLLEAKIGPNWLDTKDIN
jgi:DNA polymerase I-like protein with 3'-5' exonuclease and polymerase domains